MPVAFRAVGAGSGESSWDRSRGFAEDFLGADFVFLGRARAVDSSAARRASFSAFFREASRRFWVASSLLFGKLEAGQVGRVMWEGGFTS